MGVLVVYGCVVALLLFTVLLCVFTTHEPPSKPVHTPLSLRDVVIGFWEPLRGTAVPAVSTAGSSCRQPPSTL